MDKFEIKIKITSILMLRSMKRTHDQLVKEFEKLSTQCDELKKELEKTKRHIRIMNASQEARVSKRLKMEQVFLRG